MRGFDTCTRDSREIPSGFARRAGAPKSCSRSTSGISMRTRRSSTAFARWSRSSITRNGARASCASSATRAIAIEASSPRAGRDGSEARWWSTSGWSRRQGVENARTSRLVALSFTIRLIYIPREMPPSSGFPRNRFTMVLLLGLVVTAACARDEPLLPSETFRWVEQPIAFAPPPPEWRREGGNGGGMLGVRFILVGGGGQCIEIAAQRDLAERDRRDEITKLIAKRGSLEQNE